MEDIKDIESAFKRLFDPEKIEEQIRVGHENWLREEKENPNNFSYWAPKLGPLVGQYILFMLPDWFLDAYTSGNIADRDKISTYVGEHITPIVQQAFPTGECFMKNGCYSGKFSFDKSCHLTDLSNESIVEHLLSLEYDALMYETYGDLELVFRPYIHPKQNTPTIYGGMPLRVELRAFYDFDKRKYMYDEFYWDWDYCHDKLDEHDKRVFEQSYDSIKLEFEKNRNQIKKFLKESLKDVELTGKWSVDVLVGPKGNYHIIDMAIAERSAYWKE